MKTNNNITKIKSAMISVFMTITLLSFNLPAQETFNTQFSMMNESSFVFSASTNTLPLLTTEHIYTSAIEIPMEDWMLDPASWKTNTETLMEKIPAGFIEEQLEIEAWMVDPDWTNIDEEIQMEKWMTSPKSWVSR